MIEQLFTDLPTDLLFYLAAIVAVIVAGISKGGFGAGLGVVGVPLIALTLPVNVAAAIMLPILISMDVIGIWAYRGKWSWPLLWVLLPAAFLGILIGTFTFEFIHEAWIRLIIGAIALIFSAKYFIQKFKIKFRNAVDAVPKKPSIITGYFWGIVAGFTSFVAHAGGPPVGAYLLPQKLDKTLYQATTVFFFTFVNIVKLVPYGMTGQFDGNVLGICLILLPLAPISMYLGIKLHNRVSPDMFYLLCYGFLSITGLKLIFDWLVYII